MVALLCQEPTLFYHVQLCVVLIPKINLWSKMVTEYQHYICGLNTRKEEGEDEPASVSLKIFPEIPDDTFI